MMLPCFSDKECSAVIRGYGLQSFFILGGFCCRSFRALVTLLLILDCCFLRVGFSAECNDPRSDADVHFCAKALGTTGSDTVMEVLKVEQGTIPLNRQVVLKHSIPKPQGELLIGASRQSSELIDGHTYCVFAKHTSVAGVFSELWGVNYCEDTIAPFDSLTLKP